MIPFKGIWPLNHHLVLSVGRLARLLYDFPGWFRFVWKQVLHANISWNIISPCPFTWFQTHQYQSVGSICLYPIICPSCRVPHYAPTWGWACSPNQLHQFSLSLSLHSLETPWKGVSKNRNFISLPLSIHNRICLMKFPSWTKTTLQKNPIVSSCDFWWSPRMFLG